MDARNNITTIARTTALFIGAFTLLNLLAELRGRFDLNLWWIDLRRLPNWLEDAILLLGSLLLLTWAFQPRPNKWRRRLGMGVVYLLLGASLGNAIQFYRALARNQIATNFPIPLSLFIAAALLLILFAMLRNSAPPATKTLRQGLLALSTLAACMILFPLAQMVCFGWTDYRRPADVAVVLGAKVYANGNPSPVLHDRVKTACDLYHAGLVHKLIFSGGPGTGPIDEPAAMRTQAIKSGVPADAIILDHAGLNTAATVQNTAAMFHANHPGRILVVSHFYHLPRIKMTYQRAGWTVYTVPARQTWVPRQLPYYLAREVAALWVYYIRGQ